MNRSRRQAVVINVNAPANDTFRYAFHVFLKNNPDYPMSYVRCKRIAQDKAVVSTPEAGSWLAELVNNDFEYIRLTPMIYDEMDDDAATQI